MATYFGAARPAHAYRTKVRWLLGCLSTLIMVLVCALVYAISLSESEPGISQLDDSSLAYASALSKRNLLVPNTVIEAGRMLDRSMFRIEALPIDEVPLGAVAAEEQSIVWGKFSGEQIKPDRPLLHSSLALRPHPGTLPIPPGYRAATIKLGERAVVEGYVAPDKRVDVLLTYKDQRGIKTVDAIIKYVKVLSFNGGSNPDQNKGKARKQNTVTLLVSKRDAKRLELAKEIGKLSLSLRGDKDAGEDKSDTGSVQISDVIKTQVEEERDPEIDGTVYYTHPITGKQIRRQLIDRKWRKAEIMGAS